MSAADEYVVEVRGPKGVRRVHLPKAQVEFFKGCNGDPYIAAAWLAYADLWATSDGSEEEANPKRDAIKSSGGYL